MFTFTVISLLIYALVLGVVSTFCPQFTTTVRNWFGVGVINTAAVTINVWVWVRRFILCLTIAVIGYVILLTTALVIHSDWFLLFVVLLGAVPAFIAVHLIRIIQKPMAEASKILREKGEWLWKHIPATFSIPVGSATTATGLEKLLRSLGDFLGIGIVTVFNGAYLTVSLPLKLLSGCILSLGYIVEKLEKTTQWLTRILAGVTLTLLFLAAMASFTLQFHMENLTDPWVITIAALLIMISSVGSLTAIEVVTKKNKAGRPYGMWFFGTLASALLGLVMFAHLFPSFSGGLAGVIENGYNTLAKYCNIWRIEGTITPDAYVTAKFTIPLQYQLQEDKTVTWTKVDKSVESGSCGVVTRTWEPAERRGTRRPMVQVYWSSPEDPDLVLADTRLSSDQSARAYWVPTDFVSLSSQPCSYREKQKVSGEQANQQTRTEARPANVGLTGAPPEYLALVDKYLAIHPTVDRNLVLAIIDKESRWDPNAVSPRGAQGLMQLMPSTAQLLGVSNPFDPEQNIRGGIEFLESLQNQFASTELVLAAYNWGPEHVRGAASWAQLEKNAPEETRNYVPAVLARAQALAHGGSIQLARAFTPRPVNPEPETVKIRIENVGDSDIFLTYYKNRPPIIRRTAEYWQYDWPRGEADLVWEVRDENQNQICTISRPKEALKVVRFKNGKEVS